MNDDLERIITRTVEGQLRTYGIAHPSLVAAVNWGPKRTKLDTFVSSGAKRITRALLCDETIARLRSALANSGGDIGDDQSSGSSE